MRLQDRENHTDNKGVRYEELVVVSIVGRKKWVRSSQGARIIGSVASAFVRASANAVALIANAGARNYAAEGPCEVHLLVNQRPHLRSVDRDEAIERKVRSAKMDLVGIAADPQYGGEDPSEGPTRPGTQVADLSPLRNCPDHSPERPHSPYLADYDPRSVMHPRSDEHDAYFGNPWLFCDDMNREDAPFPDGLSAGDLLAMEMIYPASGAPSLGPSTWLAADGARTFRHDHIFLQNDWSARGAHSSWFQAPYWSIERTDGTIKLYGQSSALVTAEGSAQIQITHIFTDPYDEYHLMNETVSISTSRHAAGVINAVY